MVKAKLPNIQYSYIEKYNSACCYYANQLITDICYQWSMQMVLLANKYLWFINDCEMIYVSPQHNVH